MELSKHHREALLNELCGLQEAKARLVTTLNNLSENNEHLRQSYEVDDFLTSLKIHAINIAIINNEIDY